MLYIYDVNDNENRLLYAKVYNELYLFTRLEKVYLEDNKPLRIIEYLTRTAYPSRRCKN